MTDLEVDWKELADMVSHKSEKLGQAEDRRTLLQMIYDANSRLDEIEKQLSSNERGNNLRNVKELIQKKNAVDQEISMLEQRVTDISERGQQMMHQGHYDAQEISRQVDALIDRFNALQEPLDNRRCVLDDSLKWHQLAFDADVELQWINEKRLVAESRSLRQSLTEVSK